MDVREKLIEILRKPIFPHELVDPTEAVADYLLDSGVTVQEWISVKDRLPEKNHAVLGWYKDNPFAGYTYGVVSWNEKGWVFVYTQRYVTNVTHWMPMPSTEGIEDDT